MHAGSFAAATISSAFCILIEARNIAGDCPVKKFDILRKISDVLAKRFGRPLLSAARSRRMLPRAGCQTPTRARASDDFPEPLGPIIPNPCPLLSSNEMSLMTGFSPPGGKTVMFATDKLDFGGGSRMGSCSAGNRAEQLVDPLRCLGGPRRIPSNLRWPIRRAQAHETSKSNLR